MNDQQCINSLSDEQLLELIIDSILQQLLQYNN